QRLFDNALDYPYLYWIGAYRHNEVSDTHRLSYLITRIKSMNRPLVEIQLQALKLSDVNQMTAYILNTYPMRTAQLSDVIYQTSAGNPLFVNESLRWLHSYKHLHLAKDGVWTWDNEQLRHTKIPETALDLFKDKIAKQSSEIRDLLGVSACLGASFDAKELALVMKLSLPVLFKMLSDAFADNILMREKEQIFFFHDQVQAAAESFLDDLTKQQVHNKIAQAFISTIPEQCNIEQLPNLFSIVEHLLLGRAPSQTEAQKRQEAELNFYAGKAAMKALAMDNANFFFHQSLQIFPNQCWNKDYDFLFSLHKYLARTEMALGNQPASEKILQTLIKESKNDLDRIDCLYEQTTGLSSMGKFKQAIEVGNQGLAFFNRQIPEDDALALQKSAQIIEQIHQGNNNIWQKILGITPSGNRETKIETGIYSELIPDYYLSGMVPQLYLAAIQSTQNCLSGGVDETVIYGFSMVGLYLQRKGQYEMSFNYEDLGLALSDRYPETFGATKGINGILWTNMHNRRNSEFIIEQCQKNIHRGKNCGDLYNAGLSYGPYIWHLINQGQNLQQVADVAKECSQFSQKFNLSLSLGLAQSAIAGWSDLMLTGKETYNSTQMAAKLRLWEENKHVVSIGGYFTLKGISHFYLGNYEIAEQALSQAKPFLRGLSDNILNRLWYVFWFVNALSLNKHRSADDKAYLKQCLKQVKTWAKLGPILKPYLLFMKMEKSIHQQNFSNFRRYAFDAIDLADKNKFTLLEAYINERLGIVYIEQHHHHANYHLTRAVTLYRACQAAVKEKQLCERFSLTVNVKQTPKEQPLAEILDINFLLEATLSITQQLDFNLLLSTIIQAVMERVGAKTAYLLIANNQQLEVMARGDKHDFVDVKIKNHQSIATENLSMAIVNYVFRTSEVLVLKNASKDVDFNTDKTIQKQKLKSILCIPLVLKKDVLGVLYLENKLMASVFTHEQVELTKLLTAQAAVALQNTALIKDMKQNQREIESLNINLEQRVEERTAELNRVNEELSNFAYVVSHDLKAPLRAINQLSGWIAEDYASSFDDQGREQMALICGRAKRMHEMIDGILQYSRIGRVSENTENVDLLELIKDVIQLIAPLDNMKINILTSFPVIQGEKARLFQVFQNLIDNAIKYNDKENGIIDISCKAQQQNWQIFIKDNGPGIAKKYQEKIFQLFQTLKPKDQMESTGIGLSLIEKTVSHWGGKIWIESEEGNGSVFIFTIPRRLEVLNTD
ncbi:MAG: GAF domain-containing protein, partial [Methylococcaceae bacterium]|nr:GAF domain-containing protein [Methylococcaceae bacterium]